MSIHSNSISELSDNVSELSDSYQNDKTKSRSKNDHVGDYEELKFKININEVAMDRETLPLHYLLEEINRNPDL